MTASELRVRAGWAYIGLLEYLKARPTSMPFTAEDVRASIKDLAMPSCGWGGVIRKAAKRGLIRNTGSLRVSKNPKRHRGRNTVWEKTLPRGIDLP